jgi:TP901 family phage tail tape measure protein
VPIKLDLKPELDQSAARREANKAEDIFKRAGQNIGTSFGKQFSGGLSSASSDVQRLAREYQRMYDKAASSAGKLKVEEEKLAEVREKGISGSKLVSQVEKVNEARRNEARMVRETISAYKDLQQVQGQAVAPTGIQSSFSKYGQSAATGFTSSFGSAFKGAAIGSIIATAIQGGVSGILGTVAEVGRTAGDAFTSAFGASMKAGIGLQQVENEFKGASNATAAQMAQMSAKAKQLGSDISLPGISAKDAAEAMTQLVKDGFSVEQAIDAARSVLLLHTAAQIDAAKAAEILGDSMNMFQINTGEATHVADLFSYTVGQSSVSMTQLQEAMGMGGFMAHGYGMSIEETLAFLGALGKMGEKGSDAGTMLKTMFRQLVDPSQPVQEALNHLGITVQDAQGHFVGFESILRQVARAAQTLPQMDFLQSISTAFGSDASRMGIFAAQHGDEFYRQFLNGMTTAAAGSTQRMADSLMGGWPGVISAWNNSIDSMELTIFDAVDRIAKGFGPGLKKSFGDFADFLAQHEPQIIQFFGVVAIGATGMAEATVRSVSIIMQAFDPMVIAVTTGLAGMTTAMGTFLKGAGKAMEPLAKIGLIPKDWSKNVEDAGNSLLSATNSIEGFRNSWERGIGTLDRAANSLHRLSGEIASATAQAEENARADIAIGRFSGIPGAANAIGGAAGKPPPGTPAPVPGAPSGGSNWWNPHAPAAPPPADIPVWAPQLPTTPKGHHSGSSGTPGSSGYFDGYSAGGGVTPYGLPDVHGAHPQLAYALAAIQQLFPGMTLTAGMSDHAKDHGWHPRGQAIDIGGGTPEEQAAVSNWLLQFAPYIQELIHSGPGVTKNVHGGQIGPAIDMPGSVYNSGQAGYHGDHVHLAITDKMAAEFEAALNGGGVRGRSATPVMVDSFGSSARGDLSQSMGQIGTELPEAFGLKEGLPGIAKWITGFLANLAFAPVIGALSGLKQFGSNMAQANGFPTGGSGLSGMFGSLAGGFGGGGQGGGMLGGLGSGASGGFGLPGMLAGSTFGGGGGGGGPSFGSPNGFSFSGGGGGGLGNLFGSPGVRGAFGGGLPGSPALPGINGSGTAAGPGPGMGGPTSTGPSFGGSGFGVPQGGPSITPGAPGAPGAPSGINTPQPTGRQIGSDVPQGPGLSVGGGLLGFAESAIPSAISAAAGAAGSAGGAAAPGAGAAGGAAGSVIASAAQIGIDAANRTAGFLAQSAAIGAGGILETLSLSDTSGADLTNSLVGRIAAGVAGARPTLPNLAGMLPQQNGLNQSTVDQGDLQTAGQVGDQQQQGQGGMTNGVYIENFHNGSGNPSDGQRAAKDLARQTYKSAEANAGPGGPAGP